MTKSQL